MDKMKPLIDGFPEQIRDGLSIGNKAGFSPGKTPVNNILIAGMGGSGIGGNLVEILTAGEIKVPVKVLKTYDIPEYVGPETLFVASSFSGNTEETLSGMKKAMEKGAQIAGITSGGQVEQICREHNFEYVLIPGESKSPRANIGYSVIQLLFLLHKKGLIGDGFISSLNRTGELLENDHEEILHKAEELAGNFHKKFPFIYSDEKLLPVATRFQQQINENAKQIAHVNFVPEFNHNELVGWEHPDLLLKETSVLFIQSDYDHPRVTKRMEISSEIVREKATRVDFLRAKGHDLLEQCFYLINLLDWTSYHLSQMNSVDPFPVKVIDHLKNELAKVK